MVAQRTADSDAMVGPGRPLRIVRGQGSAGALPSWRFDHVAFPATTAPAALRAKAIAFYHPQYFLSRKRDSGCDGQSSPWVDVSAAQARFDGHEQPKLPGELGFYDLSVMDIIRRQTELASLHGIHGFCFRHDWHDGRASFEHPLVQFAAASDIEMRFCLCRTAVAKASAHAHVEGGDDARAYIAHIIPFLRNPRYFTIGGRPLLAVERVSLPENAEAVLQIWREYCRDAGVGELFVAVMECGGADPRIDGFDAAIEQPLSNPDEVRVVDVSGIGFFEPRYAGMLLDYREVAARAEARKMPQHPLIRCVLPDRDDEPRHSGAATCCIGATPARYGDWLRAAVDASAKHPVGGEPVVFIDAWNGWTDGAYLEPDRRLGYARLHATRAALTSPAPRPKVALMSHDANPHGAQYVALSLLREYVRLGIEVEILMLGPGWLEAEFGSIAPIHRLYAMDADALSKLASELHSRGFDTVIANTSVCGRVIAPFHAVGLKIIALIHELPGVISSYALEEALRVLVDASRCVVVASEAVSRGLRSMLPDSALSKKLRIRPQGLYTSNRNRVLANAADPRVRLRNRLGIPDHVPVVLTVAYADRRKGVDLLAQVAVRACAMRADMHFVWVGNRAPHLSAEVDEVIESAGIASQFHFVGLDFDTDDYFAGADVYALTSREDPFPTVVLESLVVGVPVVAFAGTGGAADMVAECGGFATQAFDLDAYAAALVHVVGNTVVRERLGTEGRDMVDREFGFRRYALDLLALAGDDVPQTSAVVPNYNYARYLPERIDSLAAQTQPLSEIVVLDDASTDNSIEMLRMLHLYTHPQLVVVRNQANSGSVFRQWLDAARRATGELLWIAEADDAADPRMLETLATAMQADTGIVMAYCQSSRVDALGDVIAADYLGYTDDLSPERWRSAYTATGAEEVEAGLAVKNTVPNVSAVLFRREALLAVLEGHIDEILDYRVAGDWVVYLRLLRLGRIHFDPRVLNRHRFHGANVTGSIDARRHYDEVVSAQALARALYPLGTGTIDAAAAYAARLRAHLGLAEEG
jgi:glycosyltransferase involved in cell wall biosynthesis